MKSGIFARRAMVDQARESLCYQRRNLTFCLTQKRSPVLTHHNFVLRHLCYYYAILRPHQKCLYYFVLYGYGKLDLRFVHGRAKNCVGSNKICPKWCTYHEKPQAVFTYRISSFKRRPAINAAFGKGKTPPSNKRWPLIHIASSNAQMRR